MSETQAALEKHLQTLLKDKQKVLEEMKQLQNRSAYYTHIIRAVEAAIGCFYLTLASRREKARAENDSQSSYGVMSKRPRRSIYQYIDKR